jgi:superfamily I DNA/RNA helicase
LADARGGREIAIAPPAASERDRDRESESGGDNSHGIPLTDEQRAIVEYGDGPLVVIAGAGTGKTRVIVERVRHLLQTKPGLLPENLLVLTYNVKAAQELQARIEELVGAAARARMTVSNFHSFCHGILSESAGEADMPAHPDVLDGIGQYLLLRDLQPALNLVYHASVYTFPELVKFINRAKDELVTPDAFDAYVARERQAFEDRFGSYVIAVARLAAMGKFGPQRDVRRDYAKLREAERAEARGEELPEGAQPADFEERMEKTADREARRTVGGTGKAWPKSHFLPDELAQVEAISATYVADGAALEVLRLDEIGRVYRAYQEELHMRGALDFGEQISAVTELFKRRPNTIATARMGGSCGLEFHLGWRYRVVAWGDMNSYP